MFRGDYDPFAKTVALAPQSVVLARFGRGPVTDDHIVWSFCNPNYDISKDI